MSEGHTAEGSIAKDFSPSPICPGGVWRLFFVLLCLASAAFGQAKPTNEIPVNQALVIPSVGQYGRTALHTDAIEARIVAGKWTPPRAGDSVALPDGTTKTWQPVVATPDGWISSPSLRGGYASITLSLPDDRIFILEAAGHNLVYVNGEPHVGDPYETGKTRIPVRLHKGSNELLFLCGRGRFRAKLVAPKSPVVIDLSDPTLPDLLTNEKEPPLGALVVINATSAGLTNLRMVASTGQGKPQETALPSLPPLCLRKVGFRLPATYLPGHDTIKVKLALTHKLGKGEEIVDTAEISLRVRQPNQTHKRTFLSAIDNSVQYYAVTPAQPVPGETTPPALFLTLHGAGVEALGQAEAISPKTWGHVVAPTNRRPYGFDWEDWGRMDALEVLETAQKSLHTDPRHTYLLGHSMGGHGTWQIGLTFPDKFAAIGPSAGWISFQSYAGVKNESNPDPRQAMLQRAASPGDTLALIHNTLQEGIYILHGSADDNVPVTEAREMAKQLGAFHHDWVYFEQPGAGHWWDVSDEPGADCVDWLPMFDLFAHHQIPTDDSVRDIDFTTANPGISSRCRRLTIEAQTHPLQFSTVHVRYDPGARRFVATTTNVARLSFSVSQIRPDAPIAVELDGQKFPALAWPGDTLRFWFQRSGDHWVPSAAPPPGVKGPLRAGPLKDAFRNRMLFVCGTKGTPEENAWAYAKARYDAETFWYRGNGSVEIVSDLGFVPTAARDRNVILYGNADTNGAWQALLGSSPVQVKRGEVRIGDHIEKGEDLACLFLRPRPGSDTACVGVVSGTGPVGMRLTDRVPIFISGVGFPDCLVLSAETLTNGIAGVRAAGFFGNDWDVPSGDFTWRASKQTASR